MRGANRIAEQGGERERERKIARCARATSPSRAGARAEIGSSTDSLLAEPRGDRLGSLSSRPRAPLGPPAAACPVRCTATSLRVRSPTWLQTPANVGRVKVAPSGRRLAAGTTGAVLGDNRKPLREPRHDATIGGKMRRRRRSRLRSDARYLSSAPARRQSLLATARSRSYRHARTTTNASRQPRPPMIAALIVPRR